MKLIVLIHPIIKPCWKKKPMLGGKRCMLLWMYHYSWSWRVNSAFLIWIIFKFRKQGWFHLFIGEINRMKSNDTNYHIFAHFCSSPNFQQMSKCPFVILYAPKLIVFLRYILPFYLLHKFMFLKPAFLKIIHKNNKYLWDIWLYISNGTLVPYHVHSCAMKQKCRPSRTHNTNEA